MKQLSSSLPADYSVSAMRQTVIDDLARRYSTSLPDFIRGAWHLVEPQDGEERTELIWNWHLDEICDVLQAVTRGEKKRVIFNIPPGTSKALDVNTHVLTTWGWKKHGQLQPGDYVFGPDGMPKKVLGRNKNHKQKCYRVTFDDKSNIVAAESHLWQIFRDYGETPRIRREEVVETVDLMTGSRPDAIQVCTPIKMGPRRLLIDPYLLGAWLGDGASDSGSVFTSEQDIDSAIGELGEIGSIMEPDGLRRMQRFYRIRIPDLVGKLRILGLLNNKHIPPDYLESSIEQRLELLRGLMDTDGSCSKNGSCSLVTGNKRLARNFRQLVASLGMKPFTTSRYTKLNGKTYGPHYKITFAPRKGVIVFKLERKQSRVSQIENPRKVRRYIRSVEYVGVREVNCITVEGELYLAGREFVCTHNSLTVSVFWPAWEWAIRPGLRYLTFSFSDANTIRDNLRVRDICTSKWYRKLFWENRSRKEPVKFAEDQNVKVRFNTSEKGWRIASSVEGKGLGEHPHRIILDDLLKAQDSRSEAKISAVNNWLQGTMSTRVSLKPAIVLVMQRLAENDPTRFLLDKGGWEHVLFPMHYHIPYLEIQSDGQQKWINGYDCNCHRDRPDPRDHRTVEGELLWPAKFDAAQVKEMEIDLGPIEAEGQLEGRPSPPGGTLLKREDFQIIQSIPPADIRKYGRQSCRGWDTADTDMESKTAKRSDWTVGVKISKVGPKFYVEHVKRDKLRSDKVDELIIQVAVEDGRSCKIREGEGSGKATTLARGTSLAGYDYATSPEKESKEARGTPFRREAQRGNVYLIAADWNSAYLDVVCGFPVAAHDDDWDASANAYNGLVEDAPVPRGRRAGWAYPVAGS